ncbi:MAG: hypothetical protein LBG78_05220 [Azoarcus sp.]|jgi:hypothetical protein|nr:hypothetical protein [Azoarcus sp.]
MSPYLGAWGRIILGRLKNTALTDKGKDMTALPSSLPPANRRPRTLTEVSMLGQKYGDTDAFLREFLDEFYIEQNPEAKAQMLEIEPPLEGHGRHDAYYAAVAEHLARRYCLPIPAWTNQRGRFLKSPYFPCGIESLKATLLKESPIAFRRRLIFVGADPLYRPRRDKPDLG